jgi:putative nucleotidyltransferase with HDIG domain
MAIVRKFQGTGRASSLVQQLPFLQALMDAPIKPTILIIEDEAGPRASLRMLLRPFFNLILAENAVTALRLLEEHPVDLVTLDLKLPDRQGIDLLQEIKLAREEVEVIIITGYGSLKSAMDGIRFGAAAYLLKPFNVTEVIMLIHNILEKKRRLDRCRDLLKHPEQLWEPEPAASALWQSLRSRYRSADMAAPTTGFSFGEAPELAPLLSDLLEARGRRLLGHAHRTSHYATLIAAPLALSERETTTLRTGAFLHDIGLVGLPGNPAGMHEGELDDALHRRHPEIGARMMHDLSFPAEVTQIIAYHHERYDGTGYPDGLRGDGIPLLARVVGVAQALDHLLEKQTDQASAQLDTVCEQVGAQAGTRFDSRIVEIALRAVKDSGAPSGYPAAIGQSTPQR